MICHTATKTRRKASRPRVALREEAIYADVLRINPDAEECINGVDKSSLLHRDTASSCRHRESPDLVLDHEHDANGRQHSGARQALEWSNDRI